MKLYEYQSKKLFSRFGIPIPSGDVATTPAEARQVAERLGVPVVVKAQVLTGGRGKAGGVKLANTPLEAEARAGQILGMDIKGFPVHKVLIDAAVPIQSEIYLALANDRVSRCPVLIGSAYGGVDIEEVAAEHPEKIVREPIHPMLGLREYQIRSVALGVALPYAQWGAFATIARGLYQMFRQYDAVLAEINPLISTGHGTLLAVDGKVVLDENALYRQSELDSWQDFSDVSLPEKEAKAHGLSFISLEGNIGCLVNGAGLAMGTMDIVHHFGGEPANFLDIGGGASAEKVATALRLILQSENVKAILVNIFGGITRCDDVARGILDALQALGGSRVPLVVRLVGTNEEQGRALLSQASVVTATSLTEAAKKAIAIANGTFLNDGFVFIG